jgi:hypothetical protein
VTSVSSIVNWLYWFMVPASASVYFLHTINCKSVALITCHQVRYTYFKSLTLPRLVEILRHLNFYPAPDFAPLRPI